MTKHNNRSELRVAVHYTTSKMMLNSHQNFNMSNFFDSLGFPNTVT